jgi:RNA polymerase sigma-70 factor (ECF subfamily)
LADEERGEALSMDDQAVIARVLAGDTDAFRELVLRYQQPLWGFIGNLVRDRQECEDLAQEVFLAAYVHLRSYDPHRSAFSTWLYTIARNRCLNLRKRRRPSVRDVMPEPADARTPDLALAEDELFRRLDAELDALPLEQKSVFVLSELQDLSHEEVARIEGVKVGTVKSRLSRARAKLRAVFTRLVEQRE